jgi:NAD(P)-dependent dehydrogenase (short-subunit alcohol dehydrogenase family)
MPEKSIRHLDMGWLETVMRVNAFGPILAAKHFLPLMPRTRKTVFAALSARVGSITDNHLGGWHGYRASKAALNMFLKTAAIEYARSHKQASVIGLHPGTVATPLSRPYQKGIPEDKLFTPDYATRKLLDVIENVTPKETGQIFAWDGSVIPA